MSRARKAVRTGCLTVAVVALLPALQPYERQAAPLEIVSVTVALARPHLAEERALAEALVDPAGPAYHSFLTPAAYARRFGLPRGVRARTLDWLRGGGLEIAYASPLGDLVSAAGTAAQVERLFRARIPRGLPVAAVLGLDRRQRFAPLTSVAAGPTPPPAGITEYDVRDLAKAYGAPAGNGGDGVALGVVMAGNPVPVVGSLRMFEDAERLPRVPVRTVLASAGAAESYANAYASEWMLDVQAATGMAPRAARLDLYAARTLEAGDVTAAFSRWANDPHGPSMLSASLAYCEALPVQPPPLDAQGAGVEIGNSVQVALEPALLQAFNEGRTLFAGSGDSGSSCQIASLPGVGSGNGLLNQGVPEQGYPATSPYATAVGGTVLDLGRDGRRRSERSWAFTGGGSSLVTPEPAWQRSEPAVARPCPLAPGTVCRGVPDIAAFSGNPGFDPASAQGMRVWVYGTPTMVGGTSLSTPLAMGMWARVAAASARPLGPAAPAIYRVAADPARRARDFFDVTGADRGVGNGLYLTGPGWDYTSGYGVPDIAALARDLTGRTAARRPGLPAAVPEVASGCDPFGTSPPGNTKDFGDDTLDMTEASMASRGSDDLVITVSGPHLDMSPSPPGAPSGIVRVQWRYAGADYVAQAVTDAAGLKATAGRLDEWGPGDVRTVTAAQRPGVLTITVPLSAVGSPAPGARLRYPVAVSGLTSGFGVTDPIDVADVAGPEYDHTVGRCD